MLFFPTAGSTNDVAAACVERWTEAGDADALEGLVVLADAQTAGRGRHGRVWQSPPGSGLYVSVLLTPWRARVDPARAATLVTLAAGVALAEGVEAATGLRADLKWPNDLLAGGRKLSGILAEASSSTGGRGAPGLDTVIVGFGINVHPAAFPAELADRATSIETELGRAVDRAPVLAAVLSSLAGRYEDLLAGRFDAILDAWRRRAPSAVGRRVRWTGPEGTREGVAAGIDDRGALLVRTAGGTERIVAGEVAWL
ncbi:MAG: biotin--[acetyl-CoA-carboxylase] ligase [Acidobacteria bacterium]|nr:biotin--[acetyl-CoA-carboxylase] ligase [Acidobacteriota bacterium]